MRPRKTILCIDDNEQALSVRKFMLETRGYRVLSATHSDTALNLFREGGIDLVLSDLIMPHMDGNELVRRMKELSPDVPMIIISGCIRDFDRAGHADAFLPKGACMPLDVLERIRLLIARRRGPKKPVSASVPPPLPLAGNSTAAANPLTGRGPQPSPSEDLSLREPMVLTAV
jgi:two-component system response regulator CpxR